MSDIISEVINRKLVLKTLQAIQEQKTNLLPIHDLAAHLIISIEQQLENSFKKEQPRTTTTTASNPNQHNPNPNPNQHNPNPNPNQHNPNPNQHNPNPKASTGKASITSFSSAKTKVLELLESMTLLSSSSTGSDVVEFYHLVYNSTTAAQGKSSTPPSDKSFKSPVHYISELEVIRDIIKYLLSIDSTLFLNGLVYLSKALVEDVAYPSSNPKSPSTKQFAGSRVISCLVHQLLVQIIAIAFPDAFFGRNVKDSPDSPARQVFNHYAKFLGSGKGVGNTLLWISCQQSFSSPGGKRVVHPKCVEIWFSYFYPLFASHPSNTWDKKNALLFIDTVLDNLIKQPMSVRYDPMDMAVLPMPTFSSLFNAVFLPSSSTTPTLQQALEKIYRKTKFLLFASSRTRILTSSPAQIFSTLLSPLLKLDLSLQEELLDLLGLLFASPAILPGTGGLIMSSEMVKVWIQSFPDHTKESALLVDYLLFKSTPVGTLFPTDSPFWKKIRETSLNQGVLEISKKNKLLIRAYGKTQKHLTPLQKSLQKLALVSKPRERVSFLLFRLIKSCVLLFTFAFLFYSLVYVQCDPLSSRPCPLPFNPHSALKTVKDTSHFVYTDFGVPFYQQSLHYVEVGIRETRVFYSDYIHPHISTYIPLLYNVQKKVQVYVEDVTGIKDIYSTIYTLLPWTSIYKTQLLFKKVYIEVVNYHAPKWYATLSTILHEWAVYTVDDFFPLLSSTLNKKYKQVEPFLLSLLDHFDQVWYKASKSDFVLFIKSHWVTERIRLEFQTRLVPLYESLVNDWYPLLLVELGKAYEWLNSLEVMDRVRQLLHAPIQ